jgi:transcriptional regulator
MLVHPWDAGSHDAEWREFVAAQGFGQLIAAGRGRVVPVVVPTQFLLAGDEVRLHLARPNPIWAAIEENPVVLLSVAGDWSYIPSAWKAIGDEDPALGIPTTYYAAVQLRCRALVIDDNDGKLAILRDQLTELQPDIPVVDPQVHERKLAGIRGLRLAIDEVAAKFKYGGNVDNQHRQAVAQRLDLRDGPGDARARAHLLRRLAEGDG